MLNEREYCVLMSIMSSIVWRTGTTKQKMSYPKLNCFDHASRITNTYKC